MSAAELSCRQLGHERSRVLKFTYELPELAQPGRVLEALNPDQSQGPSLVRRISHGHLNALIVIGRSFRRIRLVRLRRSPGLRRGRDASRCPRW